MALIARASIGWLAVALVLSCAPAGAEVQSLTIVAPSPAGSGWDKTAHAVQDALAGSDLIKRIEIVNTPGAGGTIGLAKFVKNARGDGSRLMITGVFMVSAIVTNRSAVTINDVTPIARLTAEPELIVVPAASPIKDVRDLIAALKSDPVKVSWAGGIAGGIDHLTVGLFAKAVGADMARLNYIPFIGTGEAVAALDNGQVTAGVSSYTELSESIAAGRLRVIGVTSRERSAFIDAPTLEEQGIDVDVVNWRGIVAAPDITAEQRKDLAGAIDRMVMSASWSKSLKARHWDDAYLSSDAFAAFLKNEQLRVAETLRAMGIAR